jgi:hypothetical protein
VTAVHEYLSTACWHELNDDRPALHAKCRASCKYGENGPEFCRCPNHTEDELKASPVSWVDQARGIALRLLAVCDAVGVDLAAEDRHLARAIAEDPALFWLRGEEQPPGEWRDTSGEARD